MATFVPAPQTAKVAIVGTSFGQTIVNTFWVTFSTAVTQAILDAIVAAAQTWWGSYMKPAMPSSYTLGTITATDQTTQNGPSSTVSVAQAGTSGSASMPNGMAVCVTERTALRGRSYRGRLYWGPLTSDMAASSDKNQITSTAAANIGAYLLGFASAMSAMATPGNHAVVSHFHNGIARASAVVTPIETYHADTFLDSQRRRLTGRGA